MRCPKCNQRITTASLLCVHCGHSLSSDAMQPTIPMLDDLLTEIPETIERPQHLPQKATLALFVAGQDRPILIEEVDELLLGRIHPQESQESKAHAAIDYELAAKAGVSRRHALIMRGEDHYTLTDLESTNGTWLNGKALLAHMPYVLNSGDQIRLAMLTIYIYFKE